MPIQLHERLSEFSYGYGVTREFERSLVEQGLSAVPFFPSLLHEAQLGFDVGFNHVGVPLMLQFKLGQAMRRFSPGPRPALSQPYWRFKIDTAEPDGQFELLLKAEMDGADVFYVAPKFHDWEVYLGAFERRRIVRQSILVRPLAIRQALDDNSIPDGKHSIVYDNIRAYVCSEPIAIEPVNQFQSAQIVRAKLIQRDEPLSKSLERVYDGFFDRSSIRPLDGDAKVASERQAFGIPAASGEQQKLRFRRVERLTARGYSIQQAIGIAVASEAWSVGAQTIFVTRNSDA